MSIRHKREPHNTAKPTEVPAGVWTPLSPRNQALRGDEIPPPMKEAFGVGGSCNPLWSIKNILSYSAKWQQRCGLSLSHYCSNMSARSERQQYYSGRITHCAVSAADNSHMMRNSHHRVAFRWRKQHADNTPKHTFSRDLTATETVFMGTGTGHQTSQLTDTIHPGVTTKSLAKFQMFSNHQLIAVSKLIIPMVLTTQLK